MPAAVARTASQSLSSAVLPYVMTLARASLDELLQAESLPEQVLVQALAIHRGAVVDEVLKQELAQGRS